MNSNTIKKYWIGIMLLFIVSFAGVIRFYNISSMPVSLYWDEAAIGYNAYSIAQTGKDEYGIAHPVLFKSFNDYKASGYIYLTALAVRFFGLNEFSIRFWSAFLGTMTVFLSYFLTVALLHLLSQESNTTSKTEKVFYTQKKNIGLFTAFLLAISPWHIQFSRVGFEANVAVFFIVLGSWLLLENIQKAGKTFILATLCFALSFYFYRSVYVFTPLFLLGNIVIFRNDLFRQRKNSYLWFGILIFLVIFIPFFPTMLSNQGMVRARQTSVFTVPFEDLMQAAITRKKLGDPKWAQIVYNRRVVYTGEIIKDYLLHFTPEFLFIQGDSNARHRTFGFGVMYLWEAPFLLFGIYLLFTLSKKVRNFVLLWVLIAPLAASVALPAPHALRSLNMLPMPQLLTGMGLFYFLFLLQGKKRVICMALITLCIITSFIQYVVSYQKTIYAVGREWADGYKQLTQYVFANEYKYDKIIVSGYNWQPYIYFLFYKKYDPTLFQQSGNNIRFDKYMFGGTEWDHGIELHNSNLKDFAHTNNALVALSPKEYDAQKKHIQVTKRIYDHAGEPIFIVGTLR